MRLLFGDAHRGQSIQNFLALYLKFSREIINTNFVHPVLFRETPFARLAGHNSPIRVRDRSWVKGIIP